MRQSLRKLFLILLLLHGFSALWAQPSHDPAIDTLKKELLGKKEDSSKVKLMLILARKLRFEDAKEGLKIAQEALVLAETLKHIKFMAQAHRISGLCYRQLGNYPLELASYLESLPLFESLKDTAGLAESYGSIGNLYFNLDKFDLALEYQTQALQLQTAIADESALGGTYNNLGSIYRAQKRYDTALVYFHRALAINQRVHNRLWESNNLSNIGLVYSSQEQWEKSLEFHQRALDIRTELKNKSMAAYSHYYIAGVHKGLGDLNKSYRYLSIARAVSGPGDKRLQMLCLELEVQLLEKQQQYEQALKVHKAYISLKDSLEGPGVMTRLSESYLEYKNRREDQMEAMRRDKLALETEMENQALLQRQQRWIWAAGFALVLLLLAVLFFRYQYQNKKRSGELLERKVVHRTQALNEANEEMSRFIYQSSHDMRSPLTSVKGLADIALSEEAADSIKSYVNLILDRVNHLDGVHTGLITFMFVKERLAAPQSLELLPVVEQAISRVKEKRAQTPVQWKAEVPPQLFVTADPMLLDVVLDALLLNAVDFRRKEGALCTVSARAEGGQVVIEVQDNGPGIAPEFMAQVFDMFKRGSHLSRGSGLGLYTAQKAAAKCSGIIELSRSSGEGTVFSVLLKGK